MKLNPHATSYVPVKMSNNEEVYDLLINMIQQQAAPEVDLKCFHGNPLEYNHRSIQRSRGEMDSGTKVKIAETIKIYKGRGSSPDQALCARTIIPGLQSCSRAS